MSETQNKKILVKPLSDEWKKNIICVAMVTISTVIYCFGVTWFLEPANLFSGGVTGIAQLIAAVSNLLGINFISKYLGVIVLLLNIPVLIFGWKKVSKRFAICSVISIAIQTILLNNVNILLLSELQYYDFHLCQL